MGQKKIEIEEGEEGTKYIHVGEGLLLFFLGDKGAFEAFLFAV